MSGFTAVAAGLALSVERGRITEGEALHAAFWKWREVSRRPASACANEPPAVLLASDLAFLMHIMAIWRKRAAAALSRAEGAAERAIRPLLEARAPSAELLAAARTAADGAAKRRLLTDHEITRLVEREVWFFLHRKPRA